MVLSFLHRICWLYEIFFFSRELLQKKFFYIILKIFSVCFANSKSVVNKVTAITA